MSPHWKLPGSLMTGLIATLGASAACGDGQVGGPNPSDPSAAAGTVIFGPATVYVGEEGLAKLRETFQRELDDGADHVHDELMVLLVADLDFRPSGAVIMDRTESRPHRLLLVPEGSATPALLATAVFKALALFRERTGSEGSVPDVTIVKAPGSSTVPHLRWATGLLRALREEEARSVEGFPDPVRARRVLMSWDPIP